MTTFDAVSQFKRLLDSPEQAFRVAKSLGSNEGIPVLLGLDENCLHLLIPVTEPENQDLSQFRFRSLSLGLRTVELVDIWSGTYIDMFAPRESFDLSLFAAISDELIAVLRAGESIAGQLSTVAKKWIQLLSTEEEETANKNQVIGLLGELVVLESLVDSGYSELALSSWVGNEKARHDFEFSRSAFEVKSSATLGQKTATIHGLEQLSSAKFTRLYLAHFQFEWDPRGDSLNTIYLRIKSKLDATQQVEFEQKVEKAGFDDKRLSLSSIYTYKLSSSSLFFVDEQFPKITSAILQGSVGQANRISRVQYVLDLTGLEAKDISENMGDILGRLATK